MTKINELKSTPIQNDQQLDEWKATWDGKYESIPQNIHTYLLTKLNSRVDEWEKLANTISRDSR